MKKIAMISEHASPIATLGDVDSGGQNVYVAQLSLHLAALGYKVDVYTRWEDANTPQVVNWQPGVRVIHVKAGPKAFVRKEEMLSLMTEFERNMQLFIYQERLSYALVHAHFFMSGLVGLGISKTFDIPLAVTFHALGHVRQIHQREQDQFPEQRLAIEELLVKKADLVIAECPQDEKDLIKYYGADKRKIVIVPCGFSASEFYPVDRDQARQKLLLPQDETILLQLGRMVPRKGVDNVIRALSVLKEKYGKRFKMLVVGGSLEPQISPELIRLKTIVEEEGLKDQVIFEGQQNRDRLKLYYSAADLFITTPWYEPFGITPLEAMACGTPVIGANVGGIKFSVADGYSGALVPPRRPDLLAEKINELTEQADLLQQMRLNAVKHVNANFTWKKVAAAIDDCYVKLTNTKGLKITQQNNASIKAA